MTTNKEDMREMKKKREKRKKGRRGGGATTHAREGRESREGEIEEVSEREREKDSPQVSLFSIGGEEKRERWRERERVDFPRLIDPSLKKNLRRNLIKLHKRGTER